MTRMHSRSVLVCVALALSGGCTLEGFQVTPCQLNGQLAFRLHPIDGWFIDYQPRPMSVLVQEDLDGGNGDFLNSAHRRRGLWSAELKYDGDGGVYQKRPSRQLIVYGQRLPRWEVEKAAKPLINGKNYRITIADSGRYGYADLTAGGPLPACS
jgi:hypothetical protein